MAKKVVMPYAEVAERSLLAAVLNDTTTTHIENAVANLVEDDFYGIKEKRLFAIFSKLYNEGVPIEPATIHAEAIKSVGMEKAIQVVLYLSDLQEDAPLHTDSINHYITILKEQTALRKKVILGNRLMSEEQLTAQETADLLHKEADLISRSTAIKQSLSLDKVMDATFAYCTDLHANRNMILSSGFKELDESIIGWKPGSLHLLAARPAIGKTTFALQCAMNASFKKRSVMFFSLEMGKEELGIKIVAQLADVNPTAVIKAEHEALAKIGKYFDEAKKLPLLIDDNCQSTVHSMSGKIQKIQATQKIDLVIVDHAQLIESPYRKGKPENRNQELSEISRGLKKLAKTCQVPVLLLCQLNRDIEKRGKDAEPQLSDLRDSGSLEQDADQIIFISRPDAYKATLEPYDDAIFTLAKNRMGKTAKIKIAFNRKAARFEL